MEDRESEGEERKRNSKEEISKRDLRTSDYLIVQTTIPLWLSRWNLHIATKIATIRASTDCRTLLKEVIRKQHPIISDLPFPSQISRNHHYHWVWKVSKLKEPKPRRKNQLHTPSHATVSGCTWFSRAYVFLERAPGLTHWPDVMVRLGDDTCQLMWLVFWRVWHVDGDVLWRGLVTGYHVAWRV